MLKFKEEVYLNNARLTYETRDLIERACDEASNEGFKNIFFISVGGSIAIMWPIVEMVKQMSTIPVFAEQAGEIVLTDHKQLTKDSLVIMASKSGDTKETLAAAKWCKEKGIRIISLIGANNTPLEAYSNWFIPNPAKNGVEFQYMQLFLIVFRLLYNKGDFKDYPRFANQLQFLPQNLLNAKKKFEPTADEIARKYHKETYNLWIGGGEMWGEVYLFSMCVLEEMQLVKTKAVSSAEFFHGTLELVDENIPVFLVKGEGTRRVMDERVEEFCKKHTRKFVIIDPKEYQLEGIDDDFRWILAPTISSTLLVDRLAFYYEKYTGHDLDIRRYYRKIDY